MGNPLPRYSALPLHTSGQLPRAPQATGRRVQETVETPVSRRLSTASVLLLGAVVSAPLAMGGNAPGAQALIECLAFTGLLIFLLRGRPLAADGSVIGSGTGSVTGLGTGPGSDIHTESNRAARMLFAVGMSLVCFALLQTVPLPPRVLATLSPAAANINAAVSADDSRADDSRADAPQLEKAGWAPISIATHTSRLQAYWLFALLICFLCARTLRASQIRSALIAAGVISGVIAVAHWTAQTELYFGAFGADRGPFDPGRAHWPFANPNHLAVLLEISGMLALGQTLSFLRGHSTQPQPLVARLLTILGKPRQVLELLALGTCTAFLLTVCVLTASRTGLALTFFGAILQVYLFARQVTHSRKSTSGGKALVRSFVSTGAILALGTLAIVSMGGDQASRQAEQRFANGFDRARQDLRSASYQALAAYSFAGSGLGTWHLAAKPFVSPELATFSLDYAHHEYLQLAVECGMVGLLAAAAAALVLWRFTRRAFAKLSLTNPRRLALTASTCSLGLPLAHALFDFPLHIPAVALALTVAVAVHLKVGT